MTKDQRIIWSLKASKGKEIYFFSRRSQACDIDFSSKRLILDFWPEMILEVKDIQVCLGDQEVEDEQRSRSVNKQVKQHIWSNML